MSRPKPAHVIRDWREALRAYANEDEVSIDLETGGLSWIRDPVAVVGLHGQRCDTSAVLHIRGRMPDDLRKFLSAPGRLFTGHNLAGFDMLFMAREGVDIDAHPWYCTMVGEQLISASGRRSVSVSLKASLQRRVGVKITKDQDHSGWMNEALTQSQVDYCVGDLGHLGRLRIEQLAKAAETGCSAALQLEMDLLPVFARMTLNGLPIDIDQFLAYIGDQARIANENESYLHNQFGWPVNLQSPVQVKKAFKEKGVEVQSTAVPYMTDIAQVGGYAGELAQSLLDYRHARQRPKVWNQSWLDSYVVDGRVHSRFWQCDTETTRSTSSGPNLQQVPRDMRQVFAAEPGNAFVACDLPQIEVRWAAFLSHDEALLRAVEDEDVHSAVWHEVFGVWPDDDQRKLAKAMTFLLLFGGGAAKFRKYVVQRGGDISEARAARIVDAFFERFTGVRRMKQKAYDRSRRGGVCEVRLPLGARRILAGSALTPTRLLNTAVQGSAAVGLKCGLRFALRRGLHVYIGAVVHDEIDAVAPERDALEYANELAKAMVDGTREVGDFPLAVKPAVGRYWGDKSLVPKTS